MSLPQESRNNNPTTNETPYDRIKCMAEDEGRPIPALLALDRANDPFYCGAPAQVRQAQWFARLWRDGRFPRGSHLRRVHYVLLSKSRVTLSDGRPYRNTQRCWQLLVDASKFARHLGLVEPDAFEDHRNPDPHVHTDYAAPVDREPSVGVGGLESWSLPHIPLPVCDVSFDLPEPIAMGYEYGQADQYYHLEVWAEKSTVNDVLIPVCRQLGCNLVTSLGFQSISSVIRLLERVQRAIDLASTGKAVRIFYVSDYDPAGLGMPVAVARQVEFYLDRYAPGADVALTPIVLTRDQVAAYRLPRTPIKAKDNRKDTFESRHGKGAVELDALEALRPGELARIVRDAVEPYVDDSLSDRLEEAEGEAQGAVDAAWEEAMAPVREKLRALEEQARSIASAYADYAEEARRLNERLEADLAPVARQLEAVQDAQQLCQDFEDHPPDLPERPEALKNEEEERDDWLFDSQRDYEEQLEQYKAHQRRLTD
jgi:hypothetical protein